MFDFGFWELVLVAVVALIVLGPERLPVVARKAGRFVARVRRFMRDWGSEFDGDGSISELKRELRQLKEQIENDTNLDDIKDRVDRTRKDINSGIHEVEDDLDVEDFNNRRTADTDSDGSARTNGDDDNEADGAINLDDERARRAQSEASSRRHG